MTSSGNLISTLEPLGGCRGNQALEWQVDHYMRIGGVQSWVWGESAEYPAWKAGSIQSIPPFSRLPVQEA